MMNVQMKNVPTTETVQETDVQIGNQQLKADAGKLQLTLVPTEIIKAIAAVREFGVAKYHKRDSWKQVEIQRYRDALYRHFVKYLEDPESLDEESGLPSLWHVATNVAFLIELENKNKND